MRRADDAEEATEPRPDLRLVWPALAAWASAAWALGLSAGQAALVAALLGAAGIGSLRLRHQRSALLLAVAATAVALAALRVAGVAAGPILALAAERAQVEAELLVTSDPALRTGSFGPYVLVSARLEQVVGRGETTRVRSPILVLAEPSWDAVALGSRLAANGRLQPADGPDLAAVLVTSGEPRLLSGPGRLDRAVDDLRVGLRTAVEPLGPVEQALIPALVDGDDSAMPEHAVAEFQATGLTHLLAVSGANLTLVLGFLLLLARWCGIRARGLLMVAGLGVVGFVLLARAEPSVLRAAAMGVVALAGLTAGGQRRGLRALAVAVLVLILLDPWLARSIGFLLSVLATAGILTLAPTWRDALSRWLPRWLAEALAVPMAAQVVCTPVIAAVFGQVSLVAVITNLIASPAVGPATVFGLLACLTSPLSELGARIFGRLAGLAASWIVAIADRGADFPGASLTWPAGLLPVVGLVVLCGVLVLVTPRVLARPIFCLALSGVVLVALVRPPGNLGWPPTGWLLVACDVGQGDAVVLSAGEGAAVVVDAGPDSTAVDHCLDRLGISRVPLVVLTHLHADHVDGLPGVLAGRDVAEVEIGPMDSPAERFAAVRAWTSEAGVPLTRATYGEQRRVGDLAWTVIGPPPGGNWAAATEKEGSPENNASLVLLATVGSTRLLLTGDIEPPAQHALLESGIDLRADVLKVPHHGSRYQDAELLAATGASLGIISAGADNGYGHPAPETLAELGDNGMAVERTDVHGDIAVVMTNDGLAVAHRD